MNTNEIIQAETTYIVQTYARAPRVFARGEGVYLFDADGKRYLDFAAGIAVMALGHADDAWVAAVSEQAAELVHVSNLYHTAPHVELARRLVERSFADRVFFCNSGTEANEAAIKFARKWARGSTTDSPAAKTNIVAFAGGFHGRTVGALSVTAKAQYRDPFAPLMPGATFVPYNNLAAVRAAVTSETCAVIVEPVQGEGGVHPAEPAFLQGVRELCDQHGALLICDEVQCGLGRTGRLWASEAYGIRPDIMTLAKPLAGGLPIGAVLVTEDVARVMVPGDHGSTFAAGPLVCRAAQVVFDRVCQSDFLAAVSTNGEHLMNRLRSLDSEQIVTVRGAGLLVGVEFTAPVKPLIAAAADKGLIVIGAGDNVLRLCPPLVVTREQIDVAVDVIADCLKELNA